MIDLSYYFKTGEPLHLLVLCSTISVVVHCPDTGVASILTQVEFERLMENCLFYLHASYYSSWGRDIIRISASSPRSGMLRPFRSFIHRCLMRPQRTLSLPSTSSRQRRIRICRSNRYAYFNEAQWFQIVFKELKRSVETFWRIFVLHLHLSC